MRELEAFFDFNRPLWEAAYELQQSALSRRQEARLDVGDPSLRYVFPLSDRQKQGFNVGAFPSHLRHEWFGLFSESRRALAPGERTEVSLMLTLTSELHEALFNDTAAILMPKARGLFPAALLPNEECWRDLVVDVGSATRRTVWVWNNSSTVVVLESGRCFGAILAESIVRNPPLRSSPMPLSIVSNPLLDPKYAAMLVKNLEAFAQRVSKHMPYFNTDFTSPHISEYCRQFPRKVQAALFWDRSINIQDPLFHGALKRCLIGTIHPDLWVLISSEARLRAAEGRFQIRDVDDFQDWSCGFAGMRDSEAYCRVVWEEGSIQHVLVQALRMESLNPSINTPVSYTHLTLPTIYSV